MKKTDTVFYSVSNDTSLPLSVNAPEIRLQS